MSTVKCFDVVSMVVEEADKRFSKAWTLNKKDYDYLEKYCAILDGMAEEFDGEAFEASVDEITMEVIVAIECPEMTFYSPKHSFFQLIDRANAFGISALENGNISVKFVFPSLWEKANKEESK